MKKKISLLLVILMLSSLLAACGGSEKVSKQDDDSQVESYTLEGIQKKGKIVVGTSADYPPFEFHKMINGKDEIVGFDIEIAKYIAEQLCVEQIGRAHV